MGGKVLFLIIACFWCYGGDGASVGHFLVIADIHYDTDYSEEFGAESFCRTPREDKRCQTELFPLQKKLESESSRSFQIGRYGCDSTGLLVESLYSHINNDLAVAPDFILVLGDWVPHCLVSRGSMVNNLQKATQDLAHHLQDFPIIPVLGNNDVFPHNSLSLNSSVQHLKELAHLWSPWLTEQQQNSFAIGGYYSTTPFCPYGNTQDKIQFCQELTQDSIPDDPAGQFEWLNLQLSISQKNQEKVFIISHIGPQYGPKFSEQWHPKFQSTFYELILPFYDIIEGLIFGHTHTDMFGLLHNPGNSGGGPTKTIFACPGITTYDHTNPAFRVFDYSKESFRLLDYANYYLDLHYLQTINKQWTARSLGHQWDLEYRFTSSYPVKDLSDSSLVQLYEEFLENPILLKQYMHLYYNLAANALLPSKRFICNIHPSAPDYLCDE